MKVTTELIMPAGTPAATVKSPSGWGADWQKVVLAGKVREVTLRDDDGAALVGIRVNDDGSLIVTNYSGQFQMTADSNLRLDTRPWSKR